MIGKRGGIMKRLFKRIEIYNYSTMEECVNHIVEMKKIGWFVHIQDINIDGATYYKYEDKQTEYPYSAEFYKYLFEYS